MVESLLWNLCCGIFVVEYVCVCCGICVVESLLGNLCCGVFVVGSLLWDLRC